MTTQHSLKDFNKVRRQLEDFQKIFDNYYSNNKNFLIQNQKDYNSTIIELNSQISQLQNQLNELTTREKQLNIEFENLKSQNIENKKNIKELNNEIDLMTTNKTKLLNDIAQLREIIGKTKNDIIGKKKFINLQQNLNTTQLNLYQSLFGMKFESEANGILKLIFTNFDESNMNRSVTLSLDVSDETFKILGTEPQFNQQGDNKLYQNLLDALNDYNNSNDLTKFIYITRNILIANYKAT
ncbi:hypothetical protein TBLA_0A05340 [Henningerozyma blattae CBS 6284]|uniref:Kinetochore protein SPC25 n=1 Tax=Henningerozyma blattae (strain ATCC 34711 / CBS 6284 / DSM 70876 / NBRC 10599 / NRRL Y-10934 / UCD 77-7) TaxID=1071380 RepID=I2GW25_HENB6|nr:hypothetical protein TBLA_0A05340 [Tetrapisispora blattae CBS 6284]CCH58327.1 hypothetical protein TBLA_0A05340 [Tetrapisispora blattae CBS 6284]